jgi:hypothetical protein
VPASSTVLGVLNRAGFGVDEVVKAHVDGGMVEGSTTSLGTLGKRSG